MSVLIPQFFVSGAWANQSVGAISLRTGIQDNASSKYDPESKTQPGICAELIKALAAIDPQLSFQGLHKKMSLKRIEASLEKDQIDVFFCMLKSPDREKIANFLETPLYSVAHVLVVRKNDKVDISELSEIGKLEKTSGREVLVHNGSVLLENLRKFPIPVNDSGKSTDQVLKMLDTGRGRFLYVQDRDIRYYFKQNGLLESYRILPQKYFVESQFVAVSKTLDPTVVKRLEEGLKKLKSKGVIEKILTKYE